LLGLNSRLTGPETV
jgi:hypothetical protein